MSKDLMPEKKLLGFVINVRVSYNSGIVLLSENDDHVYIIAIKIRRLIWFLH